MNLSNSDIKKIVDNNKVYIFELMKDGIKEVTTEKTVWGVKIFIDYEGEVRSLSCPNESWSSCYMEHTLYYVDNKLWKERFNFDERMGLIKDRVPKDLFERFVKDYAYDYEIDDYEEALEECIKENDWDEFYYHGGKDFYNKLVEYEFNKFYDELEVSINDELKVDVKYRVSNQN